MLLDNGCSYCRYGRLIVVQLSNITLDGNTRIVATLPEADQPSAAAVADRAGLGVLMDGGSIGMAYVNTAGQIHAWASTGGDYSGQIVFYVE